MSATPLTRPEADRPLSRPDLIPPLDEVVGRYRLRFARTEADLDEVRRVRFEVFNLELGEGLASAYQTCRDEDRFDAQCQHLMVLTAADDVCIGTYRMQVAESAHAGEGFYSAGEFELDLLPREVLDSAAELGRACIDRAHRDSRVLFLLWRGLAAYVAHNRCGMLFGCSSLTSQDMAEGVRFYRQLEAQGAVHPEYQVLPVRGLECTASEDAVAAVPPIKTPKLFHTYLRHGAKVLGPPAIDREFGTIDYLTLIRPSAEQLAFFGSPGAR